MVYKTKEIATLADVHPNTVRIYEDWGFISPVPRRENGYRNYSIVHLFQLQVARTLFKCEIVQGGIRKRAREIVYACGREEFDVAQSLAETYLTHLQREYEYSLAAIAVVERWLHQEPLKRTSAYSRKEAAALLSITPETLRNWERNGLISVPRESRGYRVYGEPELERLKVIRTLRGSHYSINAILRLLTQIEQPSPDVFCLLNTPSEQDDIVTVTDRIGKSLLEAIEGVRQALVLFEERVDFFEQKNGKTMKQK